MVTDTENTEMDLDDEGEAKAPKQDQVEIELSKEQRWNRAQQMTQFMLELEVNAEKRKTLNRRDRELKALIKELADQVRTGRALADKDQVQTSLPLEGDSTEEQAKELSRMADDFSAAPPLEGAQEGQGDFQESSAEELAAQSGRNKNKQVAA